jgi:hypothetical protein
MSWHFLQEQEEESWADICSAGAPDALLKLIPTQEGYCLQDNATEFCPDFQSGTTLAPSTESHGVDTSTSSAAVFPVKTSAAPAAEQALPESDPVCGEKWPGSWVTYCPDTSSWKTRQCSLLGGLEQFSETWPRWGTMRGGECWAHIFAEHLTKEIESGFWPTPVAERTRYVNYKQGGRSLGAEVRRRSVPTPAATDWKGSSKPGQRRGQLTDPAMGVIPAGGRLNPTFVAWLMGWPIGWTDLEPLEMDRFRRWRSSHGKPS